MSMMIPKISVIIPCYNSEKYIRETIDSVLSNQSGRFSLEIIAVNDCSTDNTIKILEEYGPSICIIDKKSNEGACRARNDGIRSAKGEYIALCDHDDSWEHDKLVLQLDKFNDPKVGLVCSNADSFNECGVLLASMALERPLRRGAVFVNLLYSNFIIQSSVLIRKDVFSEIGLFDEDIFPAEDLDLWLRIADKWKVDYVANVLVHYRISSTMYSRDKIRMKQARIPVIIRHAKKLNSTKDEHAITAHALLEFAMDYWYSRRFSEARDKLKESIKYSINFKSFLYLLLTYIPTCFLIPILSVKCKLSNISECR